MHFLHFTPILVLFFSVTVFADTDENDEYDEGFSPPTPEDTAKMVKEFLCDNEQQELVEKADACLEEFGMDDNIKSGIEGCYAGAVFPVTGEGARLWHCDNTVEQIAESIVCDSKNFPKYEDDESTRNWVKSFQKCMENSVVKAIEKFKN